jgi:hypothetical protein
MLVVWLSIFGTAFLPFAKPLVAAVTSLTVAAAWFWMARRNRRCEAAPTACCQSRHEFPSSA